MKGNDLDNHLVPRDVIVWEGLLGLIDPKDEKQAARYLKKQKWGRLLGLFETNHMLALKIGDVAWRLSYQVDVVTYISPEFSGLLEHRLREVEDLPIRQVFHEVDPYLFARRLASNHSIRFIYDPDPQRQFTYGSHSRYMSPDDYNMLGA